MRTCVTRNTWNAARGSHDVAENIRELALMAERLAELDAPETRSKSALCVSDEGTEDPETCASS
jgi:hypothetical protein